MRIILFTGKGGVGKTCTSAATAIQAAKRGHRTLVMSIDPAHSLGDALRVHLGDTPQEILPNLFAQEVNPLVEAELLTGQVRKYLINVLVAQGLDKIIASEVSMLPGIGEIASLVRLGRFNRERQFDLAIVDCAPTGEALRFLKFPGLVKRGFEASRKWTNILASPMIARSITKMASAFNITLPDDLVMEAWDKMISALDYISDLLMDPTRTSVRLVMNPEEMVIRESQRAFTYFNLFGINVDAAVVNRVLPPEAGKGFYRSWYKSQQEHLEEIEAYFNPLAILKAPLREQQLGGIDELLDFGDLLYGNRNPADRLYAGQAITLEADGANLIFSVHMPLVADEEIDIDLKDATVGFTIRGRRYALALPESVVGMVPGGARLTAGRFILPFSPAQTEAQAPAGVAVSSPKGQPRLPK